jgi:hypothetical protein
MVVDNFSRTGQTIVNAIQAAEAAGILVTDVVCVEVDGGLPLRRELTQYNVLWLTTLREKVTAMSEMGYFPEEIRQDVLDYVRMGGYAVNSEYHKKFLQHFGDAPDWNCIVRSAQDMPLP